ncbi:MAG: tetratricopeptide repeat protein [Candidatus Thorarchaeota archaeon]|jgi:tetratricopeptide (TPR) repeat protein
MKPIGTITKYFPFISDQTRLEIESLCRKAVNFRDFVKLLVDRLVDETTTTEFNRFTLLQVRNLNDYRLWERMNPFLDQDTFMRPWKYVTAVSITPDEFHHEFKIAYEDAIKVKPDEYLLLQLHILSIPISNEPDKTKGLERAKELLERTPELSCFAPKVLMMEGYLAERQRDMNRVAMLCKQALEIAKKNNDVLNIAEATHGLAASLMDVDVHQALTLLEESHRMYESLDVPVPWSFVSGNTVYGEFSIAYTILGEFDLAIEFSLETLRRAAKSFMNPSLESAIMAIAMADLFLDINKPEDALEWLSWRTEYLDSSLKIIADYPPVQLTMARTMIQLGRISEAVKHLDRAHKLTLARGLEFELGLYNYVLGSYEVVVDETESALDTLQQALMIFEELNHQMFINRCLRLLTKVEIAIVEKSNQYTNPNTSGLWMTKLEEHARKRNYPGVRIQHALLKAEYLSEIGENESAKFTLKDALTYSDSPGMKTLKQRIHERLSILESA